MYACACVRACVCTYVRARGLLQTRVDARNLAYPACNCYAPYCDVIRGPSGCTTFFFSLSYKRRDFRKNVTEHNVCVLIFSTTFFSETFLILRSI
jgi:hypothetical protein